MERARLEERGDGRLFTAEVFGREFGCGGGE
jgi:hypothetical protein